jgi:trans-aconitate 2-methyltransferase
MRAHKPGSWDPDQYNRFAAEREAPLWDLAALLEPVPTPLVVDLGCGDGRLTAALHGRLGARTTVGIDSSPAMLRESERHVRDGVRIEAGDLATWLGHDVDVVFSNAALHWVGDHRAVLGRWREALAPSRGG